MQRRDLVRVVGGDPGRLEPVESPAEVVALPEDRDPGQAGLEALEDQHLEQRALIVQGHAPFLVVVGDVQRIAAGPAAAHDVVVAQRLLPAICRRVGLSGNPLPAARLGGTEGFALPRRLINCCADRERTRTRPGMGRERAEPASQASPMIAQYQALKAEHPECLLFFRLGDFYELFFEDAKVAAPALDIALTRRGRHGEADIPMCGVPVHSAEGYLERLIRQGFKVAICEQTEDPAAARRRGGKTLVERAVVRVVTPGTLTEDSLLDARAHNFLAALARSQNALALAWLDVSTGDFQHRSGRRRHLAGRARAHCPGRAAGARRAARRRARRCAVAGLA